jgi:hypothetical protein
MAAAQLELRTKLMRVAGLSAAAMVAACRAEGAVVQSTSATGLRPPTTDGSISWDVDGDGLADFRLQNDSSEFARIHELDPGRFVAGYAITSDGFAKLADGFPVGPQVPGFRFFTSPQTAIQLTASSQIGEDANREGWWMGETGYFGFKFSNAGGTHYGWGEIQFEPAENGTVGSGYTILQAWYDSTPGTAIVVGDTGGGSAVPEPSVALLALLATGGAAIYRRRPRSAVAQGVSG